MALKQKIVIETSGRRIRGSADNAIENVHVGLALACELQEAGVSLTSTTIAEMAVRIEYDPKGLSNLARAQVEIKDKPLSITSWQSRFEEAVAASRLSIVRAEGGEGVRIPNNTTLEELHMIRDAVQARIDEVEERIDGGADPAPAESKVGSRGPDGVCVTANSIEPAAVVTAVNLARRTLLLARNDAGLAPSEQDGLIEYKVSVRADQHAVVTALYPSTFYTPAPEPF